jgi:hypothetical protein
MTGTYKTKLMDDIMRRVVIRIALRHPLAMPKLYFCEKPLATFLELRKVIADFPNLNWLWLLILGGLSSFVLIFTAWCSRWSSTGQNVVSCRGGHPFRSSAHHLGLAGKLLHYRPIIDDVCFRSAPYLYGSDLLDKASALLGTTTPALTALIPPI